MRKRRKKKLFGVFAFLLAAGAFAWMSVRINATYRGYQGSEQFIEVPPGSGSAAIGQRLVAGGGVRDMAGLCTAFGVRGQSRRLQAGADRVGRARAPLQGREQSERPATYVW